MDTYNEVQTMFTEVMATADLVDQGLVDEIAGNIQEAAVEEYGPGIFVRGLVNTDMGGINFKWRRPSCRQRWDYFIPCSVAEPAKKAKEVVDDDSDDSSGLFESRLMLLEGLLPELDPEDFTIDGKPEVRPLNALLDGDLDFDAEERDKLWAHRSGD